MQLDDRPDRVYIHDLDAELASDSESDGEKLIFLPDIEKRFSRLPQHVLTGGGDNAGQEMVLYAVPQSLSVDAEHDSVRKAIVEARARAREKVAEEERARQEEMGRLYDQSAVEEGGVESAHGYCNAYGGQHFEQVQPQYEDAMDID